MKTKSFLLIFVSAFAAVLAGCTKEPPKCSDESTFALVRQIIAEQLGGREGVTDKELEENLKIELPRASAFDEKIKKFSCAAKLVAGGTIQLPITYESQLDDKDEHIVSVGGISRIDLYQLKIAVSNSINGAREEKRGELSHGHETERPQENIPAISGYWRGVLEGDGEMSIKPAAGGFNVDLNVSSPSGCAGSIEGVGSVVNNVLTLTKKEGDQVCTVTIRFEGEAAEIDENNCSYYHGAACGFSGVLNRKNQD